MWNVATRAGSLPGRKRITHSQCPLSDIHDGVVGVCFGSKVVGPKKLSVHGDDRPAPPREPPGNHVRQCNHRLILSGDFQEINGDPPSHQMPGRAERLEEIPSNDHR